MQPKLKLPKLTPIAPKKPVVITTPIGSIKNGLECLPKKDRKKILVLGDDLRMNSGIATMIREFVGGLCHHFNFAQLGAAVKHPDTGKVYDLSQSMTEELGVPECDVKVYPSNGYGNKQVIRNLINIEKPDAILHFTDPRYWIWLYEMEHEIRQVLPLMYYNIWDSIPDPEYNTAYYQSCDLLMAISKQTYGINKRLVPEFKDWQIKYVPHGINPKSFFPISADDAGFKKYTKKVFQEEVPEFTVGFNSRNIRRKCVPDIIRAFKIFTETLPEEKRSKVALLLHTQRSDQNGTNLIEVIKALKLTSPVFFSESKITTAELNYFYNQCDITINLSSNEGFGLGIAESIMAGTPVIANVTGGLQDQMGFKRIGQYLTADDYIKIKSLHDKDEWENSELEWGPWAIPVWPASTNLVGSVPTPYIFDDLPNTKAAAKAIGRFYEKSKEELEKVGEEGRQELIGDMNLSSEAMCRMMGNAINDTFKNWVPRDRFTVYSIV